MAVLVKQSTPVSFGSLYETQIKWHTWGRFINSITALFGVNSLSIIRATAVKTGILTLYFWANAMTAPAADTPSAT